LPSMHTGDGGREEGEEAECAFVRNVGGLADYAAEREITITLEIHGELTATGRKSAELMEKVNRPNVRINYDTANCEYFGAVRAEDDLPSALLWVGLVHLKDKIAGHRVGAFPPLRNGPADFWEGYRWARGGAL